jgi:hypothetical protein
MSVERAQKSEVHQTTDDATSSPANRTTPDRGPRGNPGDVTPRAADDETRVRNDPDESSFGGPLSVDDPTTPIGGTGRQA